LFSACLPLLLALPCLLPSIAFRLSLSLFSSGVFSAISSCFLFWPPFSAFFPSPLWDCTLGGWVLSWALAATFPGAPCALAVGDDCLTGEVCFAAAGLLGFESLSTLAFFEGDP
jgi:hypothetical protein